MAKGEEKFNEEHSVCPKCGGNDFTTMKFEMLDFGETEYFDDLSYVKCKNCGWNGKVSKLKPKKR